MTHVIAEPCIDVTDKGCSEECPRTPAWRGVAAEAGQASPVRDPAWLGLAARAIAGTPGQVPGTGSGTCRRAVMSSRG